jgi:hemerythrin-like domain-containing protein
MRPAHLPSDQPAAPTSGDGFEVLDACHRQTLAMLDQLAALVSRLDGIGPDAAARAMAEEIVAFFSTTARMHHEDEERHVFPKLALGDDPQIVQAVLRLRQDHNWLEEDWMEISPHVAAVANGQSWFDPDVLRAGAEVFIALSRDHIALEEACIYPQARERLGRSDRLEMGREMAVRRRAQRDARSD